MTSPNKLNEVNHAEDPASQLLEQLGWTYAPAEALASKARMRRRGWPPRRPRPPHRSWERTHGDAAAAVVPALRIASGER